MDTGRGESESKPFKTIQAAVSYVCDNYNLSSYNVTINIAAGTYEEQVQLAGYTSSTGIIILVGASKDTTIVSGALVGLSSTSYRLENLGVAFNDGALLGASFWAGIYASRGTQFDIRNCHVNAGSAESSIARYAVAADSSNLVYRYGNTIEGVFRAAIQGNSGSNIVLYADTTINGTINGSGATLVLGGLSTFATNAQYEGRTPVVSGTVTGRRYNIMLNSTCNTNNSGDEYFPGTTAGTTSFGGQYV